MSEGGITARVVGAIQIIGGGLEVALGSAGVVAPEPLTTAGGVILVAHGSDTVVAGFRSLFYGEVKQSLTQQGSEALATTLGASPELARGVGVGVDIAAGVGPSIATSITRRIAISAAQDSSERVAIAYLSRPGMQMGHNAVGITHAGETAWFHLAGLPTARFVAREAPNARYAVTELAVTGAQASRAVAVSQDMIAAGATTWRHLGPNCTTTAMQVLDQAGIIVPAWSRSPFLLYQGVRLGGEITVVGGTAATVSPALAAE